MIKPHCLSVLQHVVVSFTAFKKKKKIMLTPVVCRIPVLHLFTFTLNYIGISTTDFAV